MKKKTSFGWHLESMRADGQMSQAEHAAELGVTPGYLSAIEHGRKKISAKFLRRVQQCGARVYSDPRSPWTPGHVCMMLNRLAQMANGRVSIKGLKPIPENTVVKLVDLLHRGYVSDEIVAQIDQLLGEPDARLAIDLSSKETE